MSGLTPEDEMIVRNVIRELARDCAVFAFGPRVGGAYRETSRLDLAFALPKGARLPFTRIADIKYAFSESDLIYRVDVLDYNGVERRFRDVIDRDCLKIYEPGSVLPPAFW